MQRCYTILLQSLLIICAYNSFSQLLPKPIFSLPAGYYADSVIVSISSPVSGVQIRYTLNGSEPTINSTLYTGQLTFYNHSHSANNFSNIPTNPSLSYPHPFYDTSRANDRGWLPPLNLVFKANVLKAKLFKAGFISDSTAVATYLVKEGTTTMFSLPVIAICLDSTELFSYQNGMYVYGKDSVIGGNYMNDTVQKKAFIEYFETNGSLIFGQYAAIKNHGNGGRHAPQKSLQLKAISAYGKGYFEYQFFPNSPVIKHDRLLLRNGGHRPDCMPRDDVGQEFLKSLSNISQNANQCIVLINGEYWGVQTLKEIIDNNYFYRKLNIPKENCTILKLAGSLNEGEAGDEIPYTNLLSFISVNSLATTQNFNYVKNEMDIENFTDFECAEIFIGNGDWPNNNVKFWRYKRPFNDLSLNSHIDGRWRWIIYDLDASFGGDCSGIYPSHNSLTRALDPIFNNYTKLLRSLIVNPQYKIDFINRYADLLNSNFLNTELIRAINKTTTVFNPEIQDHVNRWRYPSLANDLPARNLETPSTTKWNSIISNMYTFANQRAYKTRKHFMTQFALTDTVKITIDVNDTLMGKVRINSLYLDNSLIKNTSKVYPWKGVYFNGNPITLEAIAYPGYKFAHWNLITDTTKTVIKNVTSDSSVIAYFIPDTSFHPINYLIINEVLASNTSNITDEYLQNNDWIEIYNPHNYNVDVAGFYLSNTLTNKKKFQIKTTNNQTIIKPYGFLLVWADGDTLQGHLHSNFKFNSAADSIYLTLPNGTQTADSVYFSNQTANISFGRYPDGNTNWILFGTPTPNASNIDLGIKEMNLENFILYPNPTYQELNFTKTVNCSVLDIYGRCLNTFKQVNKINVEHLSSGIYFLKLEAGQILKFSKIQ